MKQAQDWDKYREDRKNARPRPLLVQALPFVAHKNAALDFGAGALNDSKFLLSEGFAHVVALDSASVPREIINDLPADRFEYIQSSFEDFGFPENHFGLVNAQYALPFIAPQNFDSVFQKVIGSLTSGGILVGQFFSEKDSWFGNPDMNFFSREHVNELLSGLEIIYLQEKEYDKDTAGGTPKHWGEFEFIVRKLIK